MFPLARQICVWRCFKHSTLEKQLEKNGNELCCYFGGGFSGSLYDGCFDINRKQHAPCSSCRDLSGNLLLTSQPLSFSNHVLLTQILFFKTFHFLMSTQAFRSARGFPVLLRLRRRCCPNW